MAQTAPRIAFGFLALILLAAGVVLSGGAASKPPGPWRTLEPGLELAAFRSPQKSPVGDSLIRVLRIDTRHFHFRLLNASAQNPAQRRSVREWVKNHGLVAGINASMYQRDNKTSVSYMRTGNHVNSSWLSKDKTMLAFDPKEHSLPAARIFDRDCEDFDRIRRQYRSLIQSIRMLSCRGKNVWAPQEKIWSTAAIGMDANERFLFIHSRSPYSTHDLINILLRLPLKLKRAMYVEGGKDAQLFIQSGSREFEFVGSYSSGSYESDDNVLAWPVPNVLAIARTSR